MKRQIGSMTQTTGFLRDFSLDRSGSFGSLVAPSPILRELPSTLPRAGEETMDGSERRQLTRYNVRTPLRFRAVNLTADKSDHFTEAINISRGGFFFASSAPLQVGTPIEATLRMPAEITGDKAEETVCTARVVHVRNQPYGDGRIGFGAEIEKFQTPGGEERWLS
jgi:hypothetical protein